jgi:hypothetical protein
MQKPRVPGSGVAGTDGYGVAIESNATPGQGIFRRPN